MKKRFFLNSFVVSFLFIFSSIFFITHVYATCTPSGSPYTECEAGNLDGCNPDGSKTHHLELVQPVSSCNVQYQCTDEGPCIQGTTEGYFDAADCTNGLQGWACDQNNGSSALTVNFYTDPGLTNQVGSTVANLSRSDVAAAGDCQNTPNHGFAFQIPASLKTGTQQTVYAAAIDDGTTNKVGLNTSPRSFTCTAPPPATQKYKCSNNACVEDDTNGTFTDSSCSGSCAPATTQHTVINLALQLTGIGLKGNLDPKHKTRVIHIQIYKKGDDPTQPNISPITEVNNTLMYDNNSGYFGNGSIDLGTTIPSGDYQILVKIPRYLRKEIVDKQGNNIFTLTSGQTTILPSVQLIPGDTSPLYNVIDEGDFYAIKDCYNAKDDDGATTPPSTCAAGPKITDLNDDGVVDGIDLNIWLLGMQTLLNNNDPEGNGDGVAGE